MAYFERNVRISQVGNTLADLDSPFLVTKDIDFGEPSVRKKLHKIYVTFKSVDDGNPAPSGVKVSYSLNGGDTYTEFDDSSVNYNQKRTVFETDFFGSNYGFAIGSNVALLTNNESYTDGSDPTITLIPSLKAKISASVSDDYMRIYKPDSDSNWNGTMKWGSPVRISLDYVIEENNEFIDGFGFHCYSGGQGMWIKDFDNNTGHTSNWTGTGDGFMDIIQSLDVTTSLPYYSSGNPDRFNIYFLYGKDALPSTDSGATEFVYFKNIKYYALEGLTDTGSNIRDGIKDWVQAQLLFPSSDTNVRNAKSIKLKFEAMDGCKIKDGFEINDISIIYRPKPIK